MKTSWRSVYLVWLPGLWAVVAFLLLAIGWTGPQKPHPSVQNQAIADAVSLNEFMPDPASDWNGNGQTGDQDDEYVELFNPSADMIDLQGWQLDDGEGGSAPYVLPANSQISAGGFLLLFSSETGIALNNSGDAVRLLRPDGSVAEAYSYASTQPDEAYSKRGDGTGEWTRDYPPSPGVSNQPSPQPTATDTHTPTPGPTSTPFPQGVVLNEFMPDPISDWNGDGTSDQGDEYIELFNATDGPVDVGGWLLDDEDDGNMEVPAQNPEGSRPYAIPDGVVLPARGYLLLFRGETGVVLNNDGDWVRLLHPDGQVVEAFAYTRSADDQAYSKTVDGGDQWTVAFPPSPGGANLPPPTPTATPTVTPSPTPSTATIGGHVFEDLDGDGRFEPWAGEVGLADVLVTLSNGRSRLSSANGWYGWGSLLPGTYTVHQMQPIHTSSTTPDYYTITVVAGEERQDLSFGEVFLPSGQIQTALSLNEFLPSPGSDWDGNGVADAEDEWVEIFNAGEQPIDLGGWFLDDEAEIEAGRQGSRPYLIAPGTIVPPGGYLVLFRSTTGVALNNSGDSVRLLGPGLFELENIAYPSTGRDLSWSKTVDGGHQWTNTYPPSLGQSNQPPATPVLTATPTVTGTSIAQVEGIVINEFMPDPASDWDGDGTADVNDE